MSSLAGLKVVTFFGPGIVGEQVEALLKHWQAGVTRWPDQPAERARPAGNFDAMILDADAIEGALFAQARECRSAWGLDALPLVVVARSGTGLDHPGLAVDRVLGKPVSARRLHDALCSAIRGTSAAPVDSFVPRLSPDSLRILVAEDNEANRRVLLMMLEELGLAADEAGNGLEAVTRALAQEYDVILMDVQMPGLDGFETTRRIRAANSRNPPVIIALTANVMRGEEARCRAAGMDGYLSKPVRLDTLASTLQRLAPRPRK